MKKPFEHFEVKQTKMTYPAWVDKTVQSLLNKQRQEIFKTLQRLVEKHKDPTFGTYDYMG